MAAPVASYVQLPSDTSNSGKKNRTQTKVVGSDTVHEHYMVPVEGYTRHGRYMAVSTANRAIVNTAVALTTSPGVFLAMSTASVKVGVLRHCAISWGHAGTIVATLTAPQIVCGKYLFGTAHSATTLELMAMQTSSTTPGANVRGAPTGAVITNGAGIAVMNVPALVTTVGAYGGHTVLYDSPEPYNRGTAVEFGPGEGIYVHQRTDGTGSDSRVFTVTLHWDEIDVS